MHGFGTKNLSHLFHSSRFCSFLTYGALLGFLGTDSGFRILHASPKDQHLESPQKLKPKGLPSKKLQGKINTQTVKSKSQNPTHKEYQDEAKLTKTATTAIKSKKVRSEKGSENPNSSSDLWRWGLFPILNYNSGRGLGYGGFFSLFKRNDQDQQTQTSNSGIRYDFSLGLQFYQTLGGYAYHKLLFDLPRLTSSGLRLQITGGLEQWDQAWYSGINRFTALEPTLLKNTYYQYKTQSLWALPTLTHPLFKSPSFFGFMGFTLRQADVSLLKDSLLEQEKPSGYQGGFLTQWTAGLMWDVRDRQPDTRQGLWIEASVRGSHSFLGSDWDMWGINFTHRHWISLNKAQNLVYAYRVAYDLQGGNIPFFHQNIMGGSQWVELGGNSVLRGYEFGRMRHRQNLYSSQELRWILTRLSLKKRPIDLMLTPLLDIGYLGSFSNGHWVGSGGLGGRLIYDESFVLRIDWVFALEKHHSPQGIHSVMRRGLYALVGHSF